MINSKPNNSKYNSGNFLPKNRDKVIKFNKDNGVYYRSSWEKVFMHWLDNNDSITKWGAECMSIPYQLTHFDNGDVRLKSHTYYPDFYYEMRDEQGVLKQVVVEVKPAKEYQDVIDLNEGNMVVPTSGIKKLRNFEYALKQAQRNKGKWETMIKWCNKKGYKFIIITEHHLKAFNIK